MRLVAREKEGVIVLLRGHENSEAILDRLEEGVRHKRGTRAWDPRLHGIGAQILRDLNVGRMRVLARPKRIPSMEGFGLEVVEYVSPEDAIAVKAAV
jgi:3,4-dihydroxy 2-butanone 4-phosphate synthase/GTP cyclohydrolase II